MRIGYIGHFGDWHTEWGVSAGLERYAEVDRYHFPELDQEAFTRREYDLVLATCPHVHPVEFWRAQRGIKVAHYFDLICGWKNRERAYFPALGEFDLVLATDGNSPGYEGINCRWFPQAVNTDWYYPVAGEYERDTAFIGHAYDGKRRAMFNELSRHFSFEQFGQDGSCRGEAHARVCATTRIMIADNAVNDRPYYWSNRVYLHLASGAFVLHPRVPGMEEMFADGVHLAYYDNDLVEKVGYWLEREDERKEIARAGCALVRRRHSWTVRMGEFWEVLRKSGLFPTLI